MKKVIILGIGMIFLFTHISFACLGARPLSMGGAFVAVADDVHSCYWNPAGMGDISQGEFTAMRTMNNRDAINYQEWLAGAVKIGPSGGIGGSYIHSINWTYGIESGSGDNYVLDTKWKVLSIGGYGAGILKNTAFGLNIRQMTYALMTGTLTGVSSYFGGGANFKDKGYKTDSIGYDIGILHHINEHFTIGILIQDVNKPIIDFSNSPLKTKYRYIRNFRPGAAWQPDDKTIFAVDWYNVSLDNVYDEDVEGQTEVRLGFERWIIDGLAIRAGLYGRSFHTIGFGLRRTPHLTKVEISGMKEQPSHLELQLDYALLESFGAGTHWVSLGMKW